MSRTRRRPNDDPIEIVLPITPMLDMSFQLLAFFVTTFQAANVTEGQLDMMLPKAGEARAQDPSQIDTTKNSEDLDTSSDVTVSIAASAAGEATEIKVIEKATTTPIPGETPVEKFRTLGAVLKKLRAAGDNKDTIKIEAEGKLKYDRLVQVMDQCLLAGYRQVGFAPPPDLGR